MHLIVNVYGVFVKQGIFYENYVNIWRYVMRTNIAKGVEDDQVNAGVLVFSNRGMARKYSSPVAKSFELGCLAHVAIVLPWTCTRLHFLASAV